MPTGAGFVSHCVGFHLIDGVTRDQKHILLVSRAPLGVRFAGGSPGRRSWWSFLLFLSFPSKGPRVMASPVAPGDVLLGKYRVERVLGQGGMGVVVAARHVELGQLYAIKFLLPAMLSRSESLERFVREARAAARLESEHVAKVHDVGRMENGAPYMVMEYLDGSDLKAVVSRRGPLPVEEAATYVLQMCDAIAEAHEAGIIHRDLKPANLFLVRRRNGSPCIKVIDFGISKHTGADEVELTHTNAMFGSPLYMSPEQMARTKTVDLRTDIWAIGVILYELLAGVSPFKASTMTEVVSRVLQEEPAPLRETRPDVPPGVEEVIGRCLRKRREERFLTVEELAEALLPFGGVMTAVRTPMGTDAGLAPAVPSTLAPSSTTARLPDAQAPQASTLPLQAAAPSVSSTLSDPTTVAWGNTGASRLAKSRSRWLGATLTGAGLLFVAGLWLTLRSTPQEKAGAAPATRPSMPPEEKSVTHVQPQTPPTTLESAPAPPTQPAVQKTSAPASPTRPPAPKSPISITSAEAARAPVQPVQSTTATPKKRRGVL